MFTPRPHTHPAKFVPALLAGHMARSGIHDLIWISPDNQEKDLLAATILLYRTLTLWAFLRVGLDPVGCFTVVPTFSQPHLGNRTDNGSMITFDWAAKAKLVLLALQTWSNLLALAHVLIRADPTSSTRHDRHNCR
jgi:hypothetical protein